MNSEIKKCFFITGASSDVGTCYIQSLEDGGMKCVVLAQYRSDVSRLEEQSKNFRNVEIHFYKCDLSDFGQVHAMLDEIENAGFFVTHILHLAAGKFEFTKLKDWDWASTERDMKIQVGSFVEILKRLVPKMAKARYGRVVAMLSAYTLGVPPRAVASYLAVKSALLAVIKSMACDYAGRGVLFNGISPAMMETKFLSNLDERIVQMTAESSPMKRNMTVEETCVGIKFLFDDANTYMNGANLNLTGGGVYVVS